MANWFMKTQDQVTLGHVVMEKLVGAHGARIFSGVIVLLFMSAMSAMMLVGPRVYAAMADDGVLPKALRAKEGAPPVLSVLLQGLIAIGLVFLRDVRGLLSAIGALLVLFAALTTSGLFRARFSSKKKLETPSTASLVAASVYCLSALWMLYFGFFKNPEGKPHILLAAAGVLLIVSSIAYGLTRKRWRKG
jgi:APA family basic amino acid/polyamine antiporter